MKRHAPDSMAQLKAALAKFAAYSDADLRRLAADPRCRQSLIVMVTTIDTKGAEIEPLLQTMKEQSARIHAAAAAVGCVLA